jgi:AcrR family transcriptional regulator
MIDDMSTAGTRAPAKRSEARERLLATATRLFYTEGIGAVGVDRIVRESNVTIATLYRHFPSKDDLVVAYLQAVHDVLAARGEALAGETTGRDLVRAIGKDVAAEIGRPEFRGCAFMNAASEYQDPDSSVRRVIADHRAWFRQLVRRGFAEAGHPRPGNAAHHFVVLRDGTMSGAYLDTPTTATRAFNRGVNGLLASIDATGLPRDEDDED